MKQLAVALVIGAVLGTAVPSFAQTGDQAASRTDLGAAQGSQTFTVKHHVIVWGGLGLDLDVIGDVTAGALGTIRGTPALVGSTAFPDVYVNTQRRRYVGIGYGLFDKTEVFARYQEANNPAATVLIGQFGTATNTFAVAFDNYKDRLLEFGLRKYTATPRNVRQYFALVGGIKEVDPLGIVMQPPGGNLRAELYSKSRVPTFGLEFGLSLEFHKLGIFLESGLRYQKRLTRNDTDLAQYGFEDLNNTAIRIFIPVTTGLLLRF
jgi:hypothetical protein